MAYRLSLEHVSLLVKDLAASEAFYIDVLGLPAIANGTGKDHIRWFGIGPGQAVHVTLGDTSTTHTEKATHFCLASDDLEAVMARLEEKGVPYSDWPGRSGGIHVRPDGVRSVYIQDPDGYWIEINDAG